MPTIITEVAKEAVAKQHEMNLAKKSACSQGNGQPDRCRFKLSRPIEWIMGRGGDILPALVVWPAFAIWKVSGCFRGQSEPG